MLRRPIIGIVFRAAAVLVAGCHDVTDAEKQRVIGAVDFLGTDPPTIVAPAEVTAG